MIKVASPQIEKEDVDAVVKGLWSGRLTSGPMVAKFEEEFAKYVGTKYAISVNSGTAALHASLAGIGVQPGDEVIVPALTFFSTVTAVIHQGAIPIFCDISEDNFCLDPNDLNRCISQKTKAIIVVHYFGHCAEMDKIKSIANENEIKLIEDCAQAHGSKYRGNIVGSIGECGAFSMFATKHMTTCEGGMVTTSSEPVASYIRMFRSHGLANRDDHVLLGYNYRMPEPLGALGLSQLKRLDQINDMRIKKSEILIKMISDIPWLKVPQIPEYVKHTYFWCHVWIDEKKLQITTSELIQKLKENGIEVRNRYKEPLYRQPLLTNNIPPILKLVAGDNLPDYKSIYLKNVEKIVGRVIGLPNRPDMTMEEIVTVSEVLHRM